MSDKADKMANKGSAKAAEHQSANANAAAQRQGAHTGDGGADEVQDTVDQEVDQGYSGTVADETPNDAYTVAGVTSDPTGTPEGHAAAPDAAEKAN